MKYFITLFFIFSLPVILKAQPPEKFSFQKIIRNNNELLSNTAIGLKIDIVQGSENGNTVYSEVHGTTTNKNGLASITIGSGKTQPENLIFENIDWSAGPFYIKTGFYFFVVVYFFILLTIN